MGNRKKLFLSNLEISIDKIQQSFFLFSFYILLLFCFYFLVIFGFLPYPNNGNLVVFDAGWYQSIASDGYSYRVGQQSNIAFFPLFPLMWKMLHINPMTVSLVNGVIYILSLRLLGKYLSISNCNLLRFFFLPSVVFCFLPFSESLFYFASVLTLIGLYNNKNYLSFLGLVLSGLTRSVSVLIIPAVILSQVVVLPTNAKERFDYFRPFLFVIAIALSVISVAYIQFCSTGEWFVFLEAQEAWGKRWHFPVLPLTTWGFGRIGWLDATATVICIFSAIVVLRFVRILITSRNLLCYERHFIFSAVYLSIIGFVTLFYGNSGNSTSVLSINRYVFATPFASIFLINICQNQGFLGKENKIIYLLLAIGLFLFGIYKPYGDVLRGLIYFTAYFTFLYSSLITKKVSIVFVVLINVILFFFLLKWYMSGYWIG